MNRTSAIWSAGALALLALAANPAPSNAQGEARILQGQNNYDHHQHRRRRHLRPDRAADRKNGAEAHRSAGRHRARTCLAAAMWWRQTISTMSRQRTARSSASSTMRFRCIRFWTGVMCVTMLRSSTGLARPAGATKPSSFSRRPESGTVADLQKKEATLGGTGPGSSIVIYPTVMNNLLGTKFKIITGYKSSKAVFLAMERGEVVARSGSLTSIHQTFPQWMSEKKLDFLAQIGLQRDAEIPDAPLLVELARNEEQKKIMTLISSPGQLGQPYLAPPGTPDTAVSHLRKAFDATMADKTFLADVRQSACGSFRRSRATSSRASSPRSLRAKRHCRKGAQGSGQDMTLHA